MFCNDDSHENVIDITLANVHGDIDRASKVHAYFDCRTAWVSVNDDLAKLGGESGLEPL